MQSPNGKKNEALVYLNFYLRKDLSEYNRFQARLAMQNFVTDLNRLFEKHDLTRGYLDEAGEFVPYDDDDDSGVLAE